MTNSPKTHVIVVGAGAFGGWTALMLLRGGARVTLIDSWGPGNSRASSGGDTRVIRAIYGPDRVFSEMAARSLEIWREAETQWRCRLYHRTGMLWLAGSNDDYERSALEVLRDIGIDHETLSIGAASARYPQINFDGVNWCIFEPEAGYLLARRACQRVLAAFLAEGGHYKQSQAMPGAREHGELSGLRLSDGSYLQADQYVFACGPWIRKLFPDVMDRLITPTRQEVFVFGTPAGDARFLEPHMPVWLDNSVPVFYGIPGNENRGLKIACDNRGAEFDPTSGDRLPSLEAAKAARDYLDLRFPILKGAPLVEARVCQYENSPDHCFIIDRIPGVQNTVVVGGGSGHGFKHGPAVGERVSRLVLNDESPDERFCLKRFDH